MGAHPAAPAEDGGGDRAPRARHPRVSGERRRSGSAARAGAGEGGDSQVMRRRAFLQAVSGIGGWAVSTRWFAYYPPIRLSAAPSLLIPMDDSQSDHLKAY